ncbi:g9624 [Coccomyxa elongata]
MKLPEQHVSRKVEEALIFRLKQKAMEECKQQAQAYADCCSGRVFSAVWSCRDEFKALNACLSHHTNPQVLNELKRRWMEAGQPETPDWKALLNKL